MRGVGPIEQMTGLGARRAVSTSSLCRKRWWATAGAAATHQHLGALVILQKLRVVHGSCCGLHCDPPQKKDTSKPIPGASELTPLYLEVESLQK